MPAISIVMPLYNKAAYVSEALASIAAQSFRDIEVIVIDDGSTDNGADVVAGAGLPHVNLVRQANAGVAAARNRGVELATAPLVAFLDADDTWNAEHLHHLHELRRTFPAAALYANDFTQWDGRRPVGRPQPGVVHCRLLADYISEAAAGHAWVFTSAAMVRRDAFLDVGGFPVGESRGEDLDLWIRLSVTHAVAVSDYVGCNYRRVPDSLTDRPVLAPDVSMRTLERLSADSGVEAERRAGMQELYNRIAIAHATDCLLHREIAAARAFLRLSRGTTMHRRRWLALEVLARSAGVGSVELLRFWRRARALPS